MSKMTRDITFYNKDFWIVDLVERLVKKKGELGIVTDFSAELLLLVGTGLGKYKLATALNDKLLTEET